MASNYPGSLDSFDTIASDKKMSDSVGGRTHRQILNDLGDAIEAVQAELGTDPAGTYSTVKARLDALVAYAAKTSTYTATVADHTLNVTSGTFTLDLPAANTCTGQSLKVKNSGTGVVTLDGNSAEAVEGVATYPLGPGSYVEITSTGSGWALTAGVPDTGWRDIKSLLGGSWTATTLRIRRVGRTVHAEAIAVTGDVLSTRMVTLPAGFTGPVPTYMPALAREDAVTGKPAWVVGNSDTLNLFGGIMDGTTWLATHAFSGAWNYLTPDAWPTSLPGTAV